jgi:oligoribonuclease NrnB/cAMP/cGMP phosphodiesterase (DHH superfamily)
VVQLVTHQHCLDGATCGVLGLAAGMDPHFVYPDGALAYLESLPPEQEVVLADVSFARDAYESQASRLVALIDHHQSALPLEGLPRVHLYLDHCASTLLYRWLTETGRLTPDPRWVPLLQAVDDYDLWRPDHAAGQDLNRLLHALGWEWFRDKYHRGFVPLTSGEAERLRAVVDEEQEFVSRHLDRVERFDAHGYALAAVELDGEGAVNEIAHQLLEDGLDAVLMVKPDGRLSSRSTRRLDVARLMEAGFRGGGHPRAAGGRLPQDVQEGRVAWVIEQARRVLAQPSFNEPGPPRSAAGASGTDPGR